MKPVKRADALLHALRNVSQDDTTPNLPGRWTEHLHSYDISSIQFRNRDILLRAEPAAFLDLIAHAGPCAHRRKRKTSRSRALECAQAATTSERKWIVARCVSDGYLSAFRRMRQPRRLLWRR